MKFKFLIFISLAIIFLSSYIGDFSTLREGKAAPAIELIGNNTVNLAQTENNENYKLISFWSPKIPSTRIRNKEYSDFINGSGTGSIDFISICTDDNEALMKEVLQIDKIQDNNNFEYSQIRERVFKDYDVEESPKSFLIDSKGKIAAISPSVDFLLNLI